MPKMTCPRFGNLLTKARQTAIIRRKALCTVQTVGMPKLFGKRRLAAFSFLADLPDAGDRSRRPRQGQNDLDHMLEHRY
jgi:hypothetical protein